MSTITHRHTATHHPRVMRGARGWIWVCECGGASCRTPDRDPLPWRLALIGALLHSGSVTA